MKNNEKLDNALKSISKDRQRTNMLRRFEQRAIAYLVQRMPLFVSSNMLTGIGFLGNLILALSFVFGAIYSPYFLLFGILGSFVNWFGDSLDGRLAYFRNKPRKWYGFTLDIIVDFVGIIFIGLGFMQYLEPQWTLVGYAFIVMYNLEMVIALLRYKITNQYSIDSGFLGPTEVRIAICIALTIEVIFNGTFLYFAIFSTIILFIANIKDILQIIKLADIRDKEEKKPASES
ncbi:MAG: CDP-alcohol phosphatidyltransferase [Bacteroidales bacterium]|nr:CDP-alcohol phosphatidyltransferase [Bacteroidales bacterium]